MFSFAILAIFKARVATWIASFVPKPGEDTIDLVYKYAIGVKNTNLIVGANSRNLRIESHLEHRAKDEEEILKSLIE